MSPSFFAVASDRSGPLRTASGYRIDGSDNEKLQARISFLELLSQIVPAVLQTLEGALLPLYRTCYDSQVQQGALVRRKGEVPWRQILSLCTPDCPAEIRPVRDELEHWRRRFNLNVEWASEAALSTVNSWMHQSPTDHLQERVASLNRFLAEETKSEELELRATISRQIAVLEKCSLFWAHPLPSRQDVLFTEKDLCMELQLRVPTLQSFSRSQVTAALRRSAHRAIERKLDELELSAKSRGWRKFRKPPRHHGALSGMHLLWLARWQVEGWSARRIANFYGIGHIAPETRQGALRMSHTGEHAVRVEIRRVADMLSLPLRRGSPGRPKKV